MSIYQPILPKKKTQKNLWDNDINTIKHGRKYV